MNYVCIPASGRGPTNYWLGRCKDCGEEDLFMWGKGTCSPCRRGHDAKIKEISGPAHRRVHGAIEDGRLPKLDGLIKCTDCDEPATVYDHRLYAEPLKVEPVCKPCNWKRGPADDVAHLWRKRIPSTRRSA